MKLIKATSLVCVLGLAVFFAAGVVTAKENKKSSSSAVKSAAKSTELTGEQRGYTNDELYLRTDDGKETTFIVQIPGDKDGKWHDEVKNLSRITVTYHKGAGGKLIVTVIKKAADSGKK